MTSSSSAACLFRLDDDNFPDFDNLFGVFGEPFGESLGGVLLVPFSEDLKQDPSQVVESKATARSDANKSRMIKRIIWYDDVCLREFFRCAAIFFNRQH